MKKLLLGTAIASLVTSVAFAETKVSGSLETTIGMSSTTTSGTADDSNPTDINHVTVIKLSNSKELDNGLTMSAGFAVEDGGQQDQYLKLTSGGTTFAVGNDVTGAADNVSQEDFTPHIAQSFHDANMASGNIQGIESAHGSNGLYLIQDLGIAKLEAAYSPNLASGATVAASANTARNAATGTGSGYDLAIKGDFGVEGLTVGYGVSKVTASDSSNNDQEGKGYGIKYAYNNFTVGYGKTENTDVNDTNDDDVTSYGIAYQVNDQLSVGIYEAEFETTGQSTNEEYQSLQVGYDLGGMGITLGYYTVENVGGTSGTDGDKLEIRTVTKF